MSKILKAITAFFVLLATSTAFATTLTVIRVGPPGANTDLFTAVMAGRLAEQGWNTNVIGFADCKGAEDWVQKNPSVPVMFTTWSDDFVLPKIDPTHPRNCPGLPVSRDTLVTIIAESNHMVCSIKELSVTDFLKGSATRIGIWNHPVQMSAAKTLLLDLNVSHKLVGYARGADMMQALVAGDVDYVIVSSENLVKNVNGNCIITTASSVVAKTQPTIKDPTTTLTSVEELSSSITRPGTGLWPIYVAYNVSDMKKLRDDVSLILKSASEYSNLWTPAYRLGGYAAGMPLEVQWEKFNNFISSF